MTTTTDYPAYEDSNFANNAQIEEQLSSILYRHQIKFELALDASSYDPASNYTLVFET